MHLQKPQKHTTIGQGAYYIADNCKYKCYGILFMVYTAAHVTGMALHPPFRWTGGLITARKHKPFNSFDAASLCLTCKQEPMA